MRSNDQAVEEGAEGRPWTYGIGILLLGLLVSSLANAWALDRKHDPSARLLANTIYAVGLLVAGTGMHRLIWYRPSARPAWQRVIVTALATVPAFALAGTLLSFLVLMLFYRFG